ncbi:ParB/RepB/Spo0J family partition protein [Candidatus Uhrbacteria bacterium]|nr:ParB/RepB/Spo0J family partition protein [Candidatus Uhrbacteria bacterium]
MAKGLGRGLESLIPKFSRGEFSHERENKSEESESKKGESVFLVETDKIKENSYQPRRVFDETELKSLSDSIREHGILQPLIVTKIEETSPLGTRVSYELIAGERRLKAARLAGLNLVPVIIRSQTGASRRLELALVENIQRADLNAIEKAKGYGRLVKEFGLTQKEVAEKTGQSREVVANALRLLALPVEIQEAVANGKISEGHGKVILSLEDENQKRALFGEILAKNLSVRAAESLVREFLKTSSPAGKRKSAADPLVREWETRLEEFFGTRVKVAKSGERGRILIEFYSPEELNAILDKILKA